MKLNQKIIATLIGSALISPVAMARTLAPTVKGQPGHMKIAPSQPGMNAPGGLKKGPVAKKGSKKGEKKTKRSHRKSSKAGRRKSRTPNRGFKRHSRT
jgi:hypothetical protein